MPDFKNSGTGYTEHDVGSDAFKSNKDAENRAVHGGDTPSAMNLGRKSSRTLTRVVARRFTNGVKISGHRRQEVDS